MKKILVTTDFSDNSKSGIRLALQLASQEPCQLFFYHAVEILKPTSWSDEQFKKLSDERISSHTNHLVRFIDGICKKGGFEPGHFGYKVETGVEVDDMIMRYAKRIRARFICMSTRGAGKLKKLFGTHASGLVINSSIPVIIVPEVYRAKPVTSLFYASDFASTRKELKKVEEFAAPLHAKIMVYHYDYLLDVPGQLEKLMKKAAKYESPLISFHFRKQEMEHSLSHHLRVDIMETKPSIVVLFSKRNRSWFDRLLLPSQSADMTFNSKTPLVIFRK